MLNADAKTIIPRYGITKDTMVVLWHGAMPIPTNDRMIIAVSELAKPVGANASPQRECRSANTIRIKDTRAQRAHIYMT